MIRSNLCDYSDAYIYVKATITVPNTTAQNAAVNNNNKKVILKNFTPFTNCVSQMNNTQVEDAQYIAREMPMYNLIEYSDVCSNTSGSLWQYHRDEPALDNNNNLTDFSANNNNNK